MKYDDVDNWVTYRMTRGGAPKGREEQPYRECPNCSRFQFRYTKEYYPPLIPFIGTPKIAYQEWCKNCKHQNEREVVEQ